MIGLKELIARWERFFPRQAGPEESDRTRPVQSAGIVEEKGTMSVKDIPRRLKEAPGEIREVRKAGMAVAALIPQQIANAKMLIADGKKALVDARLAKSAWDRLETAIKALKE